VQVVFNPPFSEPPALIACGRSTAPGTVIGVSASGGQSISPDGVPNYTTTTDGWVWVNRKNDTGTYVNWIAIGR
jgi:hypothetical protein